MPTLYNLCTSTRTRFLGSTLFKGALAGYKHAVIAYYGQSTVIFSKRRKISSIWTDQCVTHTTIAKIDGLIDNASNCLLISAKRKLKKLSRHTIHNHCCKSLVTSSYYVALSTLRHPCIFVCDINGVRTQKIRVSAAVKTTPVPLHSSQSAMALLHAIGQTFLIIETDHPGT